MRFTSKKLIIGISLALMAAVPLSAGFVGTGGRGSGGGASGAYTNVVDQNAQANGYHSDIERQAAITKGYNGDDSDDANLYNAAKGRASSPYPSQHNITDSNSAAITTNHYEDDCDDYILLNSSVTGTSCTDLTKTQFLVVRSNTDAATDNGYDTHVQFKTANLLGYTKSCADSDVYLEALGRSSSVCYSTALAPPTAADCTSYISTNSLTDSSNTALTGCAAMTKTQYNAFKNWNNVQLAETAVTTATSCSGITTQNIKLFMNDQSVTNADFDFDNLSTKQSDFLKQCILDVGASRTVAQAKACGSGKNDNDLALYEMKQIRDSGTAGCGTAATYPTSDITVALLKRAKVWSTTNTTENTNCTSAFSGNYCTDSSDNSASCLVPIRDAIRASPLPTFTNFTTLSSWAKQKVTNNLKAQMDAHVYPHFFVEACQRAERNLPAFCNSPSINCRHQVYRMEAQERGGSSMAPLSFSSTGTVYSPVDKTFLRVIEAGTKLRFDVAANVSTRVTRDLQTTFFWTNQCPGISSGASSGTVYYSGPPKTVVSVMRNATEAATNALASDHTQTMIYSAGFECAACTGGAGDPAYCDPSTTSTHSSTHKNYLCTGGSIAGQPGGADWTPPSSWTNEFLCVDGSQSCALTSVGAIDNSFQCKSPDIGWIGNSYQSQSVGIGSADSNGKKPITFSGKVASAGDVTVQFCDGTKKTVATVASGVEHSFTVTSASAQLNSYLRARFDTSTHYGVMRKYNELSFNSNFSQCNFEF